jgi:hypothetical protein
MKVRLAQKLIKPGTKPGKNLRIVFGHLAVNWAACGYVRAKFKMKRTSPRRLSRFKSDPTHYESAPGTRTDRALTPGQNTSHFQYGDDPEVSQKRMLFGRPTVRIGTEVKRRTKTKLLKTLLNRATFKRQLRDGVDQRRIVIQIYNFEPRKKKIATSTAGNGYKLPERDKEMSYKKAPRKRGDRDFTKWPRKQCYFGKRVKKLRGSNTETECPHVVLGGEPLSELFRGEYTEVAEVTEKDEELEVTDDCEGTEKVVSRGPRPATKAIKPSFKERKGSVEESEPTVWQQSQIIVRLK